MTANLQKLLCLLKENPQQTRSVCCYNCLPQVAMSSVRKDLISQKGSLVALYVKPRKSAKKNIYVIGGSKRELGSAWTRSECTYQTVECFDTFKQVHSK